MAYDYELLEVQIEGRLATVTVSNPPINLLTLPLYFELMALSEELAADPDLTVVVMKSADPDFFLAHFDVEAILSFPTDEPAERADRWLDVRRSRDVGVARPGRDPSSPSGFWSREGLA